MFGKTEFHHHLCTNTITQGGFVSRTHRGTSLACVLKPVAKPWLLDGDAKANGALSEVQSKCVGPALYSSDCSGMLISTTILRGYCGGPSACISTPPFSFCSGTLSAQVSPARKPPSRRAKLGLH
jgi:hypothetical protein